MMIAASSVCFIDAECRSDITFTAFYNISHFHNSLTKLGDPVVPLSFGPRSDHVPSGSGTWK